MLIVTHWWISKTWKQGSFHCGGQKRIAGGVPDEKML
jgi:hypothetical protein